MATEVDKRVVEMQFDNRDFEKNCQASLTTLEKLKMALNFDGAKGLESMSKAANKIDFSGITKGAEAVEVRFNAMNVAGMTVISELTKGFLNLGKTIWNMSLGQAAKGGMARTLKIEQANFQMKALAKNIDAVRDSEEAQLALVERMVTAASNAVAGTAYGLDSAAAVASQLMASGVTDAEEMEKHLLGIAGAAAMTGRSFDDIGNIFTTVASNGRLMTMQLRQFSAAGLNLSATLGQSLGKTEEQINEMVHDGEISFQQFSEALSKAFGKSAQEADNTFTGVTTNIKAQMSRIGQIFTDPFVKNVIPFLKEVKSSIKRLNTVLQPFGKTWELVFKHVAENAEKSLKNLDIPRLRSVFNGIENILVSFVMIVYTIKDAFLELFPKKTLDELHEAATEFEKMTRNLVPTKETLNGLKNILVIILSPLKLVFKIVKSIFSKLLLPMAIILSKVVGAVVRLGNALKPLADKLSEVLTSSNFLDNVLTILSATIYVVVDSVVSLLTVFADLISYFTNSTTFSLLLTTLTNIGAVIGKTIVAALYLAYTAVSKLLSIINFENLEKMFVNFRKGFDVFIGIISMAISTFLTLINNIANSGTIFGDVIKFLKDVVGLVKDIFEGNLTEERINRMKTTLEHLGVAVKQLASDIMDSLKKIDAGKLIVMAFGIALIFLIWALKDFVDNSTKLVKNVNAFTGVFGGIKKALANVAKYNPVMQILLGLSVAIAAFTSAMVTLSRDVEPGRLKEVAIVMGAFAAGIMVFAFAMHMLNTYLPGKSNDKGFNTIAVQMVAMGASMLILARAAKELSTIDVDFKNMLPPLAAIASLMILLAALSVWMSQNAKQFESGGLILIFYALSIKIIASSFKQLESFNMDTIIKSLIATMGLMIALAGSIALMSMKLGKDEKGKFAGMFTIASFIIGLLVLVKLIQNLSEYPFSNMIAGLKNLAVVMAPILAFLVIMAATNAFATGVLPGMARLFIALDIGIGLLLIVVDKISSMSKETIAKAFVVTSILGKMLSTLIGKVFKEVNSVDINQVYKKAALIKALSGFMIAFSASMILIGVAAKIAQGVGLEEIALIGLVFIALGIIFKEMIKVSNSTEKAKVGPILAMVAAIASIISAVAILALIGDADIIMATSGGLAALMVALAGVIFALSAFNKNTKSMPTRNDRTTKSTVAMLLGMGVVIAAYAALMYTVNNLVNASNVDNLYVVFAGLAGCLGAVLLFVAIAAKLKDTTKHSFVSNLRNISFMMLALSGVVAVIAASVAGFAYASKDLNSTQLGVIFAGAIGTLVVMSALMIAVTRFSKDVNGLEIAKASVVLLAAATSFGIIGAAITLVCKSLTDADYAKMAGVVTAIAIPFAGILIALGVMLNALRGEDTGFFGMNGSYGATEKQIMATATAIVLMASAFAIIAAAISGLVVVAHFFIGAGEIGKAAVLLIAALASIGLIMFGLYKFAKLSSNGFNSKKVLNVGLSITLAASSLLIIAGAIGLIVMAANNISVGRTDAVIKLLTGAILSTIPLFTALFVLVKFTKRYQTADYLAAAGAMAIASTSLVIIAGAMQIIGSISVDNDFYGKMAFFMGTIVIIEGLLLALVAISKNVSGVNLLTAGATMAIAASSVLIIAGAIKLISTCLQDIKNNETLFESVRKTLTDLVVNIGIMTVIAGALAVLATTFTGPVGAEIIFNGMVKIAAAFGIFAASVTALSAAGFLFAETVKILNETTLDRQRIATNFANGFRGIIDGMLAVAPEIMSMVSIIIAGIFLIAMFNSSKAAYVAVAYITNFLVGLAAAMPAILAALDVIVNQITDHFSNQETVDAVSNAAKTLGEVFGYSFMNAIGGFIEGGGKAIAKAIISEDRRDMYNAAMYGYETWEDYMNTKAEVAKYEQELEDMMNAGNVSYDQRKEAIDTMVQAYNALISQYERWAEANPGEDKTVVLEGDLRRLAETAEKLGVFDEYSARISGIGDACEETTVELGTLNAGMTSTSVTSGTLVKDAEDAGTAVEGLGDKVNDAMKDVNTALEGYDPTDLISKMGDNFSTMFNTDFLKGIDVGKIGDAMKDPMSVLGAVMGGTAGETAANTLEHWMDEALEVIVTDKRAYEMSGGSAGWQYKWQTIVDETTGQRMYKSAAEYANAMYDKNNSLDWGAQKLKEFLGISDDVTESLGLGADGASKFSDALDELGDTAKDQKSKFEEFRDSLHDSMESALKNIYDEVSEENKIGTDEMLHRMEENTRRVGQWARQLRELAARGMSEGLLNELKDMGPQAADKVDAFARMTSDQLERANQIFAAKSALPDYATDKIIESYKEAGFNASLGFKEGVDTTAANDTMIKLGDEACESLKGELQEKSPSKRTKQMGQWAVEGLDEGIKDGHLRSRILLDIKLLTNYIMKEFEKGLDKTKMQTIALNCLKGFVDGLLKYKTVVASTIGTVASDILKSFANVFKIHSPSRVMMEMGEYMMLGFGLGMEDGTSYVEKQTGSTANDILNSMKENLKLIEGVDEQGVYQPVIRPVLDMSLVESGYLGFQDYLNNTNPLTGISLAGNLSRLTPTTTDDAPTVEYDILDAINAMDINGIRNEMTMLRNDISDLQQAMTNMQVVMDTGALVGQLVNPLDNALGNKALYNGRGRY